MIDILTLPEEWSMTEEIMPACPREGRLVEQTEEERAEAKMQWPAYMGEAQPPKKVTKYQHIGEATYTYPWGVWDEELGEYSKTVFDTTIGCPHVPMTLGSSWGFGTGKKDKTEKPPVLFFNTRANKDELRIKFKALEGDWKDAKRSLASSEGNVFRQALLSSHFENSDWAYTTFQKYVPELNDTTPDNVRWAWSRAAAEHDLKESQPKIVVAMGKAIFHWLLGDKLPVTDLRGVLLPTEFKGQKFLLYYLDELSHYLMSPEYLEQLRRDLSWLKIQLDRMNGIVTEEITQVYERLDTLEEVKTWLVRMRARTGQYWSVDCEWHGMNYKDGLLRSMQISWGKGHAVYLKFRDEQKEANPNLPLLETGRLLTEFILERDIRYIGHNLVADLLWMKHHLGLPVEGRAAFDTMFARHTIDEYADLKLERLAHYYTDMGRYDYDLWKWKRDNHYDSDEGYGTVPESIIFPYACSDVDAVYRIYPKLLRELKDQGPRLARYYRDLLLPFVTYGFMELMEAGLPIDQEHLDKMRSSYQQLQTKLEKDFLENIRTEAIRILRERFLEKDGSPEMEAFLTDWETRFSDLEWNYNNEPIPDIDPDWLQSLYRIREKAGLHWKDLQPVVNHRMVGRHFNVDSTPAMRQWLFQVKQLTPLKTTKDKGIQLSWEKVLMTVEPKRQHLYKPSTDKQTLKTLSQKDALLTQCMEVKQVATMLKTFLRGDSTAGAQEGLHQWVASDGKIHANFSLTETGRPRTWKPNILNWPKHVAKPIEAAFSRHLPGNIYGLRSIVTAPDNQVIVDLDLRTAEVVALAYYSGDTGLIGELTEEDKQFVRIDPKDPDKVARIDFLDYEGVPLEDQDRKLCISLDDPRIMRHPDGRLMHPMRDLHWEMATAVMKLPREKLDKNIHRGGIGKVGNFSIPYGSMAGNLERMVEANTGKKPEPETGDKMILAYNTKRPVAAEFLAKMAEVPAASEEGATGTWQSISGRIRHYKYSELYVGKTRKWVNNKVLNPLTRQARNYPMQELVAATTAKALNGFVAWKQAENAAGRPVQSRAFMLLYDAVSLMVPLSELVRVLPKIKALLTTENRWKTPAGYTFNFDVDLSFSKRWGVKLSPEEKQEIRGFLPPGFSV